MTEIDRALTASRQAAEALVGTAQARPDAWARPRAAGKWSPSQIVEHVARSLEATADVAEGRPSAFPRIPRLMHPLLRVVFRRLLRRGSLPNGRTTRSLNPVAGPLSPAEGRLRLEAAHARFEAACRAFAVRGGLLPTPMFGQVPLADWVRFMELHTRHHAGQIAAS